MYSKVKRIIDVILASCLLVGIWPFMLIAAIAIKCEDFKGPIFFRQKRVGKNKEYFEIYKFRSMYVETPDIPTHLLKDPDQFISKIGRILRKTSLDEVPQIFNILKGEMSFIGPRPALWNQVDLIEMRDEFNANSVRPGITGLAQVNGRDELPLEVKARFDGEYVEKLNFQLDCKIFFRTIRSVAKSEGIIEGAIKIRSNEAVEKEVRL